MSLVRSFLFLLIFCNASLSAYDKKFTLMLNPAGDASSAGRSIAGTSERGITLQCAEYLKQALEYQYPNLRVILTRTPGETIELLQNASFANRLKVDLYISLHFFGQKTGAQTINFYYFCQNPLTDVWQKQSHELSFIPYQKAHIANLGVTKKIATDMTNFLTKQYSKNFIISQPLGIPFAPLIGIQSPAFAIEMSLNNPEEWKSYTAALVETIGASLSAIPKRNPLG